MQSSYLLLGQTSINIEVPAQDAEVIPGVPWGAIESFATLAYWTYQVLCRRLNGQTINYKLGESLKEEVGACLLGGHGIPAAVGLAAFQSLKSKNAFGESAPDEAQLLRWLLEPLSVNGRAVRYRFAQQKARYLAQALKRLEQESPPAESGRAFRDWFLTIPGIGYKTASWIARNSLDADDVAILDIHIYRAGVLAGFFDPKLSVEQHYPELEDIFIQVSRGLGLRASELDAVIWYEMMSAPTIVHRIMASTGLFAIKEKKTPLVSRTNKRHTNASQATFPI